MKSYYNIRLTLSQQGLKIFSSQELKRATKMTRTAVRLWLIRHIKNGIVTPLKKRRGLYCFTDDIPHNWLIANRLYRPSYISFETALSYYGILLESVYAVTSVTTKITRTFQIVGKEFTFQKIKKNAFCGYRPLSIEGKTVIIAEKEKALADYLYFVYLKKKVWNGRLNMRGIDKKKLQEYLKTYQMPKLANWSKNVIKRSH